jgi:hypothetical protein
VNSEENTEYDWKGNECSNFKEIEEQTAQIVDSGHLEKMLRIRLQEVKILKQYLFILENFESCIYNVTTDINKFV